MTPEGDPGLNYLCAGYMTFFRHIDRPAKVIVQLLRTNREVREVMPLLARFDAEVALAITQASRNDPCPCGSGRKVKKCHGETVVRGRHDMASIPLGTPRPPVVRGVGAGATDA
jgi:uncharacterized protein